MPLAGYIRVSTDEQAKEGFSIEAQKRILEASAVVKGLGNIDFFENDEYSKYCVALSAASSYQPICTAIVCRIGGL